MEAAVSKYGNVKCEVGSEKYRSKREMRRHQDLLLLQRAGEISDLKREVPFVLAAAVRYSGKRATPALRYLADFTYMRSGQFCVEDSKGVRTEGFRIKKHLMMYAHGIEVIET